MCKCGIYVSRLSACPRVDYVCFPSLCVHCICLFVPGVDCVHARVAEPEKIERHSTPPISYVLALNNRKHQLLHNYTLITELCSNNYIKTNTVLRCLKSYGML